MALAINWKIGPDTNINNSVREDAFSGRKNFDIPPSGYKYILLTSTFNNAAAIKWPSSWITIKVVMIINGINEAVSIATKANKYTMGFISKYLYIVLII